MITEARGNLLAADTEALVNTVNTVGVMGKGIALQFKRAYPDNFKAYERACKRGKVQLGKMFIVPVASMSNPLHIINFPTKRHWRSASKLADIESGLEDLIDTLVKYQIRSVAVPPLGCGNGGLNWSDVYPLIIATAEKLPEVDFQIYPPEGTPSAGAMPIRTKRPRITENRAAMLLAFERYSALSLAAGHAIDSEFSIVEAQKVAYFLQEAGWPSGFEFVPSYFGPYSQTVDQWLSAVEGHFLSGYGDGSSGSRAVLTLHADAVAEAREVMAESRGFREILDRMEDLVRGFESPYGVELLSTVHYIFVHDDAPKFSAEYVVGKLRAWSARKARLFQPRQAEVAVDHLLRVGAVSIT